jgi:hypothetical protein
MTKTLSLLAGVAMLAGASAAGASELLTTSAMDQVTAGWYTAPTWSFKKVIDVNVDKDYDIDADVDVDVKIDGNFADAEAVATAVGDDSYSETITETYADDGGSFSGSASTSAVGGSCYWPCW